MLCSAEYRCDIFSGLYSLSLYLILVILINLSLSNLTFYVYMEFHNFNWYVFIFSRFYCLMYKIIIKICVSITALIHFAINEYHV